MIAGDYIDQSLAVQGGRGAYLWSAQLPTVVALRDGESAGLRCRAWGSICGVVPDVDADGLEALLRVQDAQGRVAERTGVRIDVHPMPPGPDGFHHVPGGFSLVGYHPTRARDTWLNTLSRRGFPGDAAAVRERWPAGVMHLDGFWMKRFEVTNREYAQFMAADPDRIPPIGWQNDGPAPGELDLPVVNVTYDDAVAYCRWCTRRAQEDGLSCRFDLPTLWEWEKAARGNISGDPAEDARRTNGPGRLYPWGDLWGEANLHDLHAGLPGPVAVTAHESGEGVEDLGGNVAEWVDGGIVDEGRAWKYVRGASWQKPGEQRAMTFWFGDVRVAAEVRSSSIGFRCVARPVPRRAPEQALVPLGNAGYRAASGQMQYVGAYRMARFAVTNEEYAGFKPDHSFAEQERWRPVVEVSHQDAITFCAWKTQKEGRPHRLPSRPEWEFACRGAEARNYPWGDEYQRYRCNSLESGWGRPIDVFQIWTCASPDGIYHLCGNTFQWLKNGEAVGGSWGSTCETYGSMPYPDGSHDLHGRADIGFRYVVPGHR